MRGEDVVLVLDPPPAQSHHTATQALTRHHCRLAQALSENIIINIIIMVKQMSVLENVVEK